MNQMPIPPSLYRQPEEQRTPGNVENRNVLLENQATQLEAIIDNIPEAVIIIGPQGRLICINRVAESLLGEPPSDIKLEDWPQEFGFYLDDGKTHYPGDRMPLARALQGETVEAEEMILRQSDDTNGIWIAMSSKPLDDENGQINGAIALFRNISYRKQIELSREKHVKRTEALYKFSRAIAEAGNDLNQITQVAAVHSAEFIGDASAVTMLNPKNDRLAFAAVHHPNSAAQALLRKYMISADYDLNQGIVGGVIQSGEPLLIPSILPERLEAITLPAFADYVREYGVQSMLVVPLTGRSGVIGTLGLFRDRGGQPYTAEDQSLLTDMAYRTALAIENCRLFESLREETEERLSAKQALQASEERFRSIFESTTLGIKVLDLEGNILQTNPALQTMLGYGEAELIGAPLYMFFYPSDISLARRLIDDMKSSGTPDFRFEHRLLHKDGSVVWVKTTFTGVKKGGRNDSLAFIVGIVENITAQKLIELEIADLKNRLHGNIEMERLRLAQELHDGPMQELYSAIYQIEGLRKNVEPQVEKELENIKLDIQRVLQELRASAKELRPPTISNFGLEKAIRSHVEDLLEKSPGISIEMDLTQDQQLLPESIRLALFRVFQQSLANVMRHAEATQVQVRFTFDAEEAYLEITDNGKGFKVPRTWVELARQGHYGLAGAAERVNLLGGVFTVDSRPGSGTTIRVTIPYRESSDQVIP